MQSADHLQRRIAAAGQLALFALASGCVNPLDESVAVSSAELTVCPTGATVEGIDVSYYQSSIDWTMVKGANVAFAVTRISDGLQFEDPDFDTNWSAIKSVGLIRGAYQYFEPAQDAAAQADMVVQKVGRLGVGDLPVQLDMEVSGGQSADAIASQMNIWIERVTAGTGKRPMIYSARYFWNDNVGSTAFADYPLWVANYGVSCPSLPDAWSNWLIWQYGSTGRVPGIGGDVDVDRWNGTLDELQRFAGSAPDYGAAYVSQSFPLASDGMTMTVGQSLPAYIELRNTGTKAWDENTRLATSSPRDRKSAFAASDWPASNRLAAVKGMVAPGETYRFAFTLHAPAGAGSYPEFFSVVEEGVAWFSDTGQGGPPDDQLQDLIEVVAASGPGAVAGSAGAGSTTKADAGLDAGRGGARATGDAGHADAASAANEDAAAPADRSPDAGGRDSAHDAGGCGCRVAARHSGAAGCSSIALMALGLAARRRRRAAR